MDEAIQVSAAEPHFVVLWQGEEATVPMPLSKMLEDNADDAELCGWLRSAEVGAEWHAGGGAAPECVIRRTV